MCAYSFSYWERLLKSFTVYRHLPFSLIHVCFIYIEAMWLNAVTFRISTFFWWTKLLSFSSVQFSCSVVSDSLRPHESHTARQASLSITNSRSLIKLMPIELVMPSSHLILCRPLLLLPPSHPASGSFPMSQLFSWGGQSTGDSASASVLPVNTQDWSPSGWTRWVSLQSKGLSRVFSNTTVQKHQFFSAQLSSQSNSHIHTWPLEKPQPWPDRPLLAK